MKIVNEIEAPLVGKRQKINMYAQSYAISL